MPIQKQSKAEYDKIYRKENKIKIAEYKKSWYQRNKSRLLSKAKKYYLANKEDRIAYMVERQKSDIQTRLRRNLRSRLRLAIRNLQKVGSAIKDLGCSVSDFIVYLESKFQPGMSWDNYGDWHIDHIKPLSSFDLTKIEEVSVACHYTNLQPLWAKDNWAKGVSCAY